MTSVCGIVIAHDEDLSLPFVIRRLGLPYIAILDDPTPAVERATENAIRILRTPEGQGAHVYRWGLILSMIDDAARLAASMGFRWAIRADADEDWHGAAAEIDRAVAAGCNIVDFPICQYRPVRERATDYMPDRDQRATVSGDPLHLAPHRSMGGGNFYQRAWALDEGDGWRIMGGGHVIHRPEARIHMSAIPFRHYPAPDIATMRKKIDRQCDPADRKRNPGWHIQYKDVQLPARPVGRRRIHVYYHIATMGRWREVVREQCATITKSGLLDAADTATALWVGDDEPEGLPGAFRVARGGGLDKYEFPTLAMMHEHAQAQPQDLFCYVHTKGVSKPESRKWLDDEWRRYMMYNVVERWRECVDGIDAGADAAGCEWYPDRIPCRRGALPDGGGFFAGNFWWAAGSWLATLPGIDSLDLTNRWRAEAWIGLTPCIRVRELQNVGCCDRPGMFPRHFCGATYRGRDRVVYVECRPTTRRLPQTRALYQLAEPIRDAIVMACVHHRLSPRIPHILPCRSIPQGAEIVGTI